MTITNATTSIEACETLNASDPTPNPFQYAVRLREEGEARHSLLGSGCLTNRWLRAIGFPTVDEANSAAQWMVENNSAIDSAQVVVFGTGRVIGKIAR